MCFFMAVRWCFRLCFHNTADYAAYVSRVDRMELESKTMVDMFMQSPICWLFHLQKINATKET